MRVMAGVVGILALGVVHGALADEAGPANDANLPAFVFRGHTIGEAAEKSFPYYKKGYASLDQKYCSKDRQIDEYTCEDVTVEKKENGIPSKKIADVPLKNLTYGIYQGKIYSIDMSVSLPFYSEVRDMLVGKYGKPTEETSGQFDTMGGASLANFTARWRFKEGWLTLKMRYANADTSWLTFENPEANAKIREEKSQVAGAKGREVF